MTNDAAVAWLVTNGGKSCEPWLVWELSEVKALPSSCIADPLYSATTVAELRARVAELTADRDSWVDQASERVRNWHEEHEARKAAERRVAHLMEAIADAESGMTSLFESGDYGIDDEATEQGFAILEDIRAAVPGIREWTHPALTQESPLRQGKPE